MVPSQSYARYLAELVGQAIDAGAEAIFLEEPEFWAAARYGPAFDRAWQDRYDAPCPDPTADARTWAMGSDLQYGLYRDLIADLCRAVHDHGVRVGRPVPSYVATHSVLNYAHNRIVSPHAALRAMPECAGVILQVWSHTARFPVRYRGAKGEEPFAVAYLEYGSGLDLVRDSDRRLWFLVDPVEDRPSHGWDFYRSGYEATVAAALLHPEVGGYEVMPWPSRVFNGRFPRRREGPPGDLIAPHYAAEVLAISNAMSAMPAGSLAWESGTRGVGVLLADSLGFRRAGPEQDDPELSAFYGMALPLVLAGIPARPTGLEALGELGVPEGIQALLLSYDGMTPPDAAAHERLTEWVRAGNALICFGTGDDPYATLPAWWNEQVAGRGPWPDLYRRLGLDDAPTPGIHKVGAGVVLVEPEGPITLAQRSDGADLVRARLRVALEALGLAAPPYHESRRLLLRRGHYIIAAAFGTGTDQALRLEGRFVDLFDGDLPVRTSMEILPGRQALLVDLDRLDADQGRVAAASGRVRDEQAGPDYLRFTAAGPSDTPLVARLLLPAPPRKVLLDGAMVAAAWDAASRTALLRHANSPEGVAVEVAW
ncbi:MAG TPA: hypothetical protein VNL71_01375, partial [Chloroflexota bacterium]|nr:hypothetical protein [Chloroflexota bacterium]